MWDDIQWGVGIGGKEGEWGEEGADSRGSGGVYLRQKEIKMFLDCICLNLETT